MVIREAGAINFITPINKDKNFTLTEESSGVNFSDIFKNALQKVNELQIESQKETENFVLGKTDNIHQVMIAAERADIALQFAVQVRNKIMDAYSEIMRMQI